MLKELTALALACAPNVHPDTLNAIIKSESGGNRYAIHINRFASAKTRVLKPPKTLSEAVEVAQNLVNDGVDFDAGLGQINVRNWAWLGLDVQTVFDPCENLKAVQTVLSDCYVRALQKHTAPQQALRAALSCYNTGNLQRGFRNGYVARVVTQASIQIPALKPIITGDEVVADAVKTSKGTPPQPDTKKKAETLGTPDGFMGNPTPDGFNQSVPTEP